MHILLLLFLSIISGIILGGVFTLFRLPLPAPTNFAGVLGIFGVYLGYELVRVIL